MATSAQCSAPSRNVLKMGLGALSWGYTWNSNVPSYSPSALAAFSADARGAAAPRARRSERARRGATGARPRKAAAAPRQADMTACAEQWPGGVAIG